MSSQLDVIMDVIKSRNSFIICGHIMPDGDSLGSVLALGMVLEQSGKRVTMVCSDPVPENLAFMPGVERLVIGNDPIDDKVDAFIMLDCSVTDRLGAFSAMLKPEITTINIDHHPDNNIPADYNYIDPQAAATGEIVFDMLISSGQNISREVAICLYTAIVTDTGSFRYENTTSATHRRIAELIECGLEPGRLNELIYDQNSVQSVLLLRTALQGLKFTPCGKVAWMVVTRNMLEEVNALNEHTESLINYPRSIKGVEVAILFKEMEPGIFKVSFRSKGKVDVNKLAAIFGGGGHVKASGCVLKGEISEVTASVINTTEKAVINSKDGVW